MTDKITLGSFASFQNDTTAVALANSNNTLLTAALNNTLSRDGTSPNQMGASLDMGSNQIINLPSPGTANSPLRLQDLSTFIGGGTITVTNLPTGGSTNDHLVKNSNTNFDVKWATQAADLVAGTNIAVTGASPATVATVSNPVFSTSVTTPLLVNTGTLTLPTATDTLVGRATTDTLTNKTLTAPIVSSISNTGTLTLPTSTDTLVGRATTDTLTNKTIDTATNTFKVGGVAAGTVSQIQNILGQAQIEFVANGINFNSANTDNTITITLPTGFTRYIVAGVRLSGASASISTATAGLFTAAAGGGVAVVTGGSAITVTSSAENTNNNTQLFAINNSNSQSYNVSTLFFRIGAAQGSAATANVTIAVVPLS